MQNKVIQKCIILYMKLYQVNSGSNIEELIFDMTAKLIQVISVDNSYKHIQGNEKQ